MYANHIILFRSFEQHYFLVLIILKIYREKKSVDAPLNRALVWQIITKEIMGTKRVLYESEEWFYFFEEVHGTQSAYL